MSQFQATLVNGTMKMVCGYAAACDNTTDEAYEHPVLGPTPICTKHQRFAGIKPDRLIAIEVSVSE